MGSLDAPKGETMIDRELRLRDLTIDYDAETAMFEAQCQSFMNKFVEEIFSSECFISQEDKARFGLLCQHPEGREAFGKSISPRRVDYQEVDEFTFYRLVQYMAVCLFECNVSDDFKPATFLMNMCFTFHFTSLLVTGRFGQASKQFVYEYLTEQPIWKSPRFWNAAFLFAIDMDRNNRTGGVKLWKNTLPKEEMQDFEMCEKNSTFGHLASFLYMMKSLGVAREEREEFLEKMSAIGNLDNHQVKQLEESVEILQ